MTTSLFKLIVVSQLVLNFQSSRANITDSNFTVNGVNSSNILDLYNSSFTVNGASDTYAGCFDNSYIKMVIGSIYKNDFDNFEKVFNFAVFSDDYNFKADVLLGLYSAMTNVHHTDSPIKALTLYMKIEHFIREENRLLRSELLHKLQHIREEILWRTIVPKAAHMLAKNFFINGFNHEDTKLKRLLEVLQNNSTVFSLTIEHLIKKNSWLPRLELINLLSSLSQSAEQNVDSLLLLNDIYKFEGDEYHVFSSLLVQLSKELSIMDTSYEERRYRINDIIPTPLETLLGGKACFSQIGADGLPLFISGNWNSSEISVRTLWADKRAAFKVETKRRPLTFNFRSVFYDNQAMYLKRSETEAIEDLKFDACLLDKPTTDTDIHDTTEIEWKVQIQEGKVALQNWDGTIFLCLTNKELYTTNQTGFALLPEECKWYAENCYPNES